LFLHIRNDSSKQIVFFEMNGSQSQKRSNHLWSCCCKFYYRHFGQPYQLAWIAMHNLEAALLCLSCHPRISDIKPLCHLSAYHDLWGYVKDVFEKHLWGLSPTFGYEIIPINSNLICMVCCLKEFIKLNNERVED